MEWHSLPTMTSLKPIQFLRRIALLEGASFLLLLGIAMPLKYLADMPMAVKVVGWAHGVLFVVFCYALLQVMLKTQWSLVRCAVVFVASLLPFGPFLLDRRMREWGEEARKDAGA
jgi:integral membrane protein